MTSDFVHRVPTPALRPYVAWYSGYREVDVAPMQHRGLPSPYLTMIITLDDPLIMAAHPDPKAPGGEYDILLGGLHTTPALIRHDGRHSGIQLALSPLGTRALLGLPSGELAGIDVHGTEVLGPFISYVRERLLTGSGWDERFATLDRLLLRRLVLDDVRLRPRPELAEAWRLMHATGGNLPVADLAREVGWSTRYLNRVFATEVGLSPKAAGRVLRFDRTRRGLQRLAAGGGRIVLADVAAAHGYYDQAHLAREFGELAGCAPSRWLREEFRNIQVSDFAALAELAA